MAHIPGRGTIKAAAACLVAVAWTPAAQAQPARPDLRDMQARTAAIAQRYLAAWSAAEDGAVGELPYVYGPTIRFYGRTYTQAQLAAEKRRALRLWPVRDYRHRPGTMRVTCNAAQLRCAAQSLVDYAVENPARGTRARGVTTLDLGISFAGPRPVILYESGKVRGRDPSG